MGLWANSIDYQKTFYHVAILTFVHLLISFIAIHQWLLHQLNIKDAFLHGILDGKVNIEQPPNFIA